MRGEHTLPSPGTLRRGPASGSAMPARGAVSGPSLASEAAPYQSRSLASEALKRWLDVVLSCVLLVVAAAGLLPTCLAIMLDSPGSPLYRQWRSGTGRAAVPDPEAADHGARRRPAGPGADPGRRSADHQSRLSPAAMEHRRAAAAVQCAGRAHEPGRPAPGAGLIVETYTPRQRGVLNVRPGLTGWAQVNGRDDLPIPEKLELDREYVSRRSTRLDLEIMARTAGAVVSGRGTKP